MTVTVSSDRLHPRQDRFPPVDHVSSDILDVPTVKEGDPIPMVFGTCDLIKPRLEWYGDAFTFYRTRLNKNRDIAKVGPGFYLSMHFILCIGYLDAVIRVNIDRSPLVSGGTFRSNRGEMGSNPPNLFEDESFIFIDESVDRFKNWFGGLLNKGGVGGRISFNGGNGLPADVLAYLKEAIARRSGGRLSQNITGVTYKGVSSLFFWDPELPVHKRVDGIEDKCVGELSFPGEAKPRTSGGFYTGFDKKIQNFDFRVERIMRRSDGSAQWYPAKAVVRTITTSELVIRNRHIDTGGVLERSVNLYATVVAGYVPNKEMETTWITPDNTIGQWFSGLAKFFYRMDALSDVTAQYNRFFRPDSMFDYVRDVPPYRSFSWLNFSKRDGPGESVLGLPAYAGVVPASRRFQRMFLYDGSRWGLRALTLDNIVSRLAFSDFVIPLALIGGGTISDLGVSTGYWGAAMEAMVAMRLASQDWASAPDRSDCPYVNICIFAGPKTYDNDMTNLPLSSFNPSGNTQGTDPMNYPFQNYHYSGGDKVLIVPNGATIVQSDNRWDFTTVKIIPYRRQGPPGSIDVREPEGPNHWMLLGDPAERDGMDYDTAFGSPRRSWWQEMKDFVGDEEDTFYNNDQGKTTKWIYPLTSDGVGEAADWLGATHGAYVSPNADRIYQQLEDDIIDNLVVEKTVVEKEKRFYRTPNRLMNPVHILRELLTDPNGKNVPEEQIDDASWRAAADTVYTEGFGCCFFWDRKKSVDAFLKEVKNHIDAEVFTHSQTGFWTIKLLRMDYVKDELPVLDQRNIRNISNFSRPLYTELVNKVSTRFKNIYTGVEQSVSLPNYGLYRLQGGNLIERQLKYDGFVDVETVSRALERDLQKLSKAYISCTLEVTEVAATFLNIADVFVLNWPDLGINNYVMRVIEVVLPTDDKTNVLIKCIQDFYETAPVVSPLSEQPDTNDDSGFTFEARPLARTLFQEAPYYLVRRGNRVEVYTSQKGYALGLGTDVTPANTQYQVAFSTQVAFDASETYTTPSHPFNGSVLTSATVNLTTTVIPIDLTTVQGTIAQGSVAPGDLLAIDDEIMELVSATPTSLTVNRGVLDTIPETHASRALIFFYPAVVALSNDSYDEGQQVYGKFLSVTDDDDILALNAAPTTSLVIGGRASRPYIPGNIQVSGTDDITVSWRHRNRLEISNEVVGFYDSTTVLDREPFVDYVIGLYRDSGYATLLHEFISHEQQLVISGASIRSLLNATSGTVYIQVRSRYSTVDSYKSWRQSVNWATSQAAGPVPATSGFGFDFGEKFGN